LMQPQNELKKIHGVFASHPPPALRRGEPKFIGFGFFEAEWVGTPLFRFS